MDFDWYPYDSLVNFHALERMLTGDHRYLLSLAAGQPVLDIGCGDGSTAFFLESLGCKVCAIDHPSTNINRMRGIYRLKEALQSSIEIREIDLDHQFTLDTERYGLVLLFGTLYHLKNPFYVLETLAKHSRFCLLSTRIAQLSPDHSVRFAYLPVAYLLEEDETNSDATNYWIFSETGLRRLLRRCNWGIGDYSSFECTLDSDPVHDDADERAFCFLESSLANL